MAVSPERGHTEQISSEPVLDPEIDSVTRELRSAYAELLAALPGRPQSAIEVARALSLNPKLAWQLFRVATSQDPLSAGAAAPGASTIQQVVREARRVSVHAQTIERVADATERFHDVAGRHAETRSEFDLMVRAVTGDGLKTHNHDLKRAAFRANRELYGKCCDVDVFSLIVWPGSAPGIVHMCSVRGLVGLYRLRPDARLEISRHRFDRAEGEIQRREFIPGAPEQHPDHPRALLPEYSSEQLPPIRQLDGADGFTRWYAETPVLGRGAAITCFLADIVRESEYVDSLTGSAVGHIHEISTPSRVLIQDMLIHRDLCEGMTPQMRIINRRADAERWPGDDASNLLTVPESMRELGHGANAVSCAEAPRYPEMIADITERLGWEAEALRLYRTRIDFPVVGSVVWMRFELDPSRHA